MKVVPEHGFFLSVIKGKASHVIFPWDSDILKKVHTTHLNSWPVVEVAVYSIGFVEN